MRSILVTKLGKTLRQTLQLAALVATLMISFTTLVEAADLGVLSLYRWNPGFRAERLPVIEKSISENDFRAMVASRQLPQNDAIFSGCYMAHFIAPTGSAAASSREISSVARPRSEIFRICRP